MPPARPGCPTRRGLSPPQTRRFRWPPRLAFCEALSERIAWPASRRVGRPSRSSRRRSPSGASSRTRPPSHTPSLPTHPFFLSSKGKTPSPLSVVVLAKHALSAPQRAEFRGWHRPPCPLHGSHRPPCPCCFWSTRHAFTTPYTTPLLPPPRTTRPPPPWEAAVCSTRLHRQPPCRVVFSLLGRLCFLALLASAGRASHAGERRPAAPGEHPRTLAPLSHHASPPSSARITSRVTALTSPHHVPESALTSAACRRRRTAGPLAAPRGVECDGTLP